ncbi:hypothetical protein FH972_025514 [Carpinus fangiana]|uniref:GS catalytic domain-containing protein n=1 Tax=Carpinus fangiana TaxID=176857 RepID=A0A5N6L1N8_9ROSI|nr:hypothetical protein FH972_025514 [Carpinus fangiana]
MSSSFDAVRRVIQAYPVIDNHAHNLLREEHADVHPFESVTSEASGQALKGVHSQLSHVRAAKQLQQLYQSRSGDWDSILDARKAARRNNPQKLLSAVFARTHCILIDDGLDQTHVHPYHWHSRLTHAPSKRIVRIESVAEAIVNARPSLYEEDARDPAGVSQLFAAFQGSFKYRMKQYIEDPEVVAFKSVICYRSQSSLDVAARQPDIGRVAEAFVSHVFSLGKRDSGKKSRFASKILNEWLLHETLALIRDYRPAKVHRKPVQLHTGLGDTDIRLLQSNPAYLQPLIEMYPMVPFVLLHSAYPYTREAGYLATVYSNVFLDLGEIFPQISRGGQLAVLRQSLELTPVHKLLYSSDGHYFAETYYLAEVQFREALEVVVGELMQTGELEADQAKNLVQSILFENSNQLYRLGLSLAAGLTAAAPRASLDSIDTASAAIVPITTNAVNLAAVDYVHVQWTDYLGQICARTLPSAAFSRLVADGKSIGISHGNLGTLQNDSNSPICHPVGQIYVKPQTSTLKPAVSATDPSTGIKITSATCMSTFVSSTSAPLPSCPRVVLSNIVGQLQTEFNISPLIGFEVEVIFLRPDSSSPLSYAPYTNTTSHSWSSFNPPQHAALPLLHAITTHLAAMSLPIEQFHAESAPGQFEFILPPLPPLAAADALLQARQACQHLAHQHGLRATFHPTPLPGTSTAAHAHVSLGARCSPTAEQNFWGGVLHRLRALCAFTLPSDASYARVKDSAWTGGRHVAWGTQNREVPLRRVPAEAQQVARWEVRCVDGLANVYLALAGVLGAGLVGLREGKGLRGARDCTADPAKLTEGQQEELGIREMLPGGGAEARAALRERVEGGDALVEVLGRRLVEDYIVLRDAEGKMLGEMGREESHRFLVERY